MPALGRAGTRRGPGALARWLGRFRRDRRGAVLAEFALTFPILVTLMLGGFEICRYVFLQQKLHSVVVTMADLVSQAESLTTADLDNLFAGVRHIMKPFEMGTRGIVFVTSVSATGGQAPKVDWQRSGGGAGAGISSLGAPGGDANLPPGLVIRDGESAIIAEVFYDFAPLLNLQLVPLPSGAIYNRAVYRPRFGTLTTLN